MKTFTACELQNCIRFTTVLSASSSSLKIEVLDSREAAAYLKVSVKSLMNMCSNGQVPYHKLGRRNRYRKDELDALLNQNKRGLK